jgi:hypothetical protein
MKMNKKEQIANLQKLATTYKIPLDILDWESLIDDTLEYSENASIITPLIETLATSNNQKEKIEVEGTKKNIKKEKDEISRIELDNLKKEAEISEADFEKAINSIKYAESKELETYYNVTNKLLGT